MTLRNLRKSLRDSLAALGMATDGDRRVPQDVARVDHEHACAYGEVAEGDELHWREEGGGDEGAAECRPVLLPQVG